MAKISTCTFCHNTSFENTFMYDSPPPRETKFPIPPSLYQRSFITCTVCHHMYAVHDINLDNFYNSDYSLYTYGNIEKITEVFNRVTNLPVEQSDNQKRGDFIEQEICKFLSLDHQEEFRILDIGSGLGVFPWLMQKRGYSITALDPDKSSCEHIRKNVGVEVIQGDFFEYSSPIKYHLITLNKVLEHVLSPEDMLRKVQSHLSPKGYVYVEVPDGERAKLDGKDREEFLIEHYHAFSFSSVSLLANKTGLIVQKIERVHEPSSKFTIRAILKNPI